MTSITKSKILEKANYWINNQEFEQEMIVLEEGIEEYNYCFSLLWCKKSEEDLNWKKRTSWVGIGRLLISKDGRISEFEGSAPGVDWIHHFELKVRNLEDYWYLEIPYKKEYLSKLKKAIKCSTPEVLKMVNKNDKITFDEPKAWNDHFPEFQQIAEDLNNSGVNCIVEIKVRKKNAKRLLNSTEELLLEAIIEFDKKANELINLIAKEYNLDLNQDHPFGKLITRSNNLWKGSISDNWNYKFHGDACEFENTKTTQFLDIKINRKGNFGAINNFYLLKFIETTNSLRHVFEKINSRENLSQNLIGLENKGFIIDIVESSLRTKILNKKRCI